MRSELCVCMVWSACLQKRLKYCLLSNGDFLLSKSTLAIR
jgi:hypothetical protein